MQAKDVVAAIAVAQSQAARWNAGASRFAPSDYTAQVDAFLQSVR